MNTSHVTQFAEVGGVFAGLVFWHFLADWLPQSHDEAMAKSKNAKVRAWHVLKYGACFVPLFAWLGASVLQNVTMFFVLVISHFFIDTYAPVMLWTKYVRRPPEFAEKYILTDEQAIKLFAATPLGLILLVVMDQFFHIAFLVPCAWFITNVNH